MDELRLERLSQKWQAKFEELLESRNVYYNPPTSTKMRYDAIVFKRAKFDNAYADNTVFSQSHRYEVTVITTDPDAPIIQKVSMLPRCVHDRHFVSDNLHHNVFTIYD